MHGSLGPSGCERLPPSGPSQPYGSLSCVRILYILGTTHTLLPMAIESRAM